LLEIKSKREAFQTLVPVEMRVSFDLKGGEQVQVIGFPNGSSIWSVSAGNVSSLDGRNLVFNSHVKTGNSGSPVFYNGLVIGLVTDADSSSDYAVRAEGIFEYLNGLNSRLAESIKLRRPAEENAILDKSGFLSGAVSYR
jgi:V8-like Glu-specific endopeptidase